MKAVKLMLFYRSLPRPVRVGVEATGPLHWFERLLRELGHELWIGDSAKIRASEVRQQKTDQRDAALILNLLLTGRPVARFRHSKQVRPSLRREANSWSAEMQQ